jgi:hypothetical protein
MIAKIKMETSLKKAGLPRDEGYIDRYSTSVLLGATHTSKNTARNLLWSCAYQAHKHLRAAYNPL